MIRSEVGVVSPGTVAETTVLLATTTVLSGIGGRGFETGREEVDVPGG